MDEAWTAGVDIENEMGDETMDEMRDETHK